MAITNLSTDPMRLEQPLVIDERIKQMIAGAVAEIDPRQIAMLRTMTPAQRVWQALSMMRTAERVSAHRLRQRQPELSEDEALLAVRERGLAFRAKVEGTMAHQSIEFDEFARLVLDALEAAQLDYLIGGAVAVWAWGEARTTQDFDVVVNLPISHITRLSEELAKRDMLVPPEILRDLLLETRGDLPVNALHLHSRFKAELFLLRPWDEYRRVSFARRRLVNLGLAFGEVYVHSPEDLILNKVYYFGLSRQTKHIRDIASIITNMVDELDWAYLEEWAQKLNLTTAWYELLGEVDKLLGTGQ